MKIKDQTSRQTQAGIGHSAHVHRGGHVQNRSRRRDQRRGRYRARPEEVIPEKGNRQWASLARNARAFKQQVFNMAPAVLPDCVSPRSRPKIRTRGENAVLAEIEREGNSRGPKFRKKILTRADDRNDMTRSTTTEFAVV